MGNRNIDNGTKIQALTLLIIGMKPAEVSKLLGISISQLYRLQQKAKDRGYDPRGDPKLLLSHVEDGERSGRPRKDQRLSNSQASLQPAAASQGGDS